MSRRNIASSGFICRILCSVGLLLGSAHLQCQQIATVGSITRSSEEVASTLNSLGEASLDNSQIIQGQQQLLLANILHTMSSRLAEVYASSLNRSTDSLSESEARPLKSLAGLLNNLEDLNEQTEQKSALLILKSLDIAHDVFDHVPASDKPPVVFGAAIPGVLTPQYQNSLVILGYHLTDPKANNRTPDLLLAGAALPTSSMQSDFSKVVVPLSQEVARTIGIVNTACDPIRTSQLALRVYYVSGSLSALLGIVSETTINIGIKAPTPQFEFVVEETGTAKVQTTQTIPFSNQSGYVSVGCEQTATTSVAWQAPENTQVSNVHAQWQDLNNIGSQTQSVIPSGHSYVATGSIRGLGKQCVFNICNCPGGGHGILVLSGTYEVKDSGVRSFSSRQMVRGAELAQVKVPQQDTWTLDRLVVRITRRNCDSELDRLEIAPSDMSPGKDFRSAKGIFQVRIAGGAIAVKVVNANLQ